MTTQDRDVLINESVKKFCDENNVYQVGDLLRNVVNYVCDAREQSIRAEYEANIAELEGKNKELEEEVDRQHLLGFDMIKAHADDIRNIETKISEARKVLEEERMLHDGKEALDIRWGYSRYRFTIDKAIEALK